LEVSFYALKMDKLNQLSLLLKYMSQFRFQERILNRPKKIFLVSE
jgi:hypothetical protein